MKINARSFKKATALTAMLIVSVSCASMIQGKPVKDAKFDLFKLGVAEEPGAFVIPYATYVVEVHALKPSSTKYVGGKVVDAGERWIDASFKDDYYVMSDEMFTAYNDSPYACSYRVNIAPNPFKLLEREDLVVSLMLNSTPPFPMEKEYPIVMENLELPSFRGTDGSNSGSNGNDGRDLDFEVALYDVKGTLWEKFGETVILRELRTNSWYLLPLSCLNEGYIRIDVSGGRGAAGETGQGNSLQKGQTGTVYGGPGGPGGYGGRGGVVTIRMPKGFVYEKRFSILSFGGAGGLGGTGGTGASTESATLGTSLGYMFSPSGPYGGSQGPSGPNGPNGRVIFTYSDDADGMFAGEAPAGFDRSRLRF